MATPLLVAMRGAVRGMPAEQADGAGNDADAEFTAIMQQLDAKQKTRNPSLVKIPRFFKVMNENDMQLLLRYQARTRFLQRKAGDLLENGDLELIWKLLSESETLKEVEGGKIGYEHFVAVRDQLEPKCWKYFSPALFLNFPRDRFGRIDILHYFQYLMRRVTLEQTRVSLSFYDSEGNGRMKEQDLENYIFDLISSLPALASLEEQYHPFYVCTAVRRFFFFLDPLHKGKIPIRTLLTSRILDELFEMRLDNLSEEEERGNWFSAKSFMTVYGKYLKLDEDHNGMLSPAEMSNFNKKGLTPVFVARLFQETLTYDGEMDYKTYLDFIIAYKNKNTPQALSYFWRMLDTKKEGYITQFTINYFFRDITRKLREMGAEAVDMEDVKDEIFDMVRPTHPLHITLDDLVRCHNGGTVVTMLIDVHGFWRYDNREALLASGDDDDEED